MTKAGTLYFFLLGIFFADPALAYVDPGAGSLMLQLLAAAGVGLLFYIRKIRIFFATLFGRTEQDPQGGSQSTDTNDGDRDP